MPITNDHLVGFAVGVGASAVAFYWYDQNRDRINEFLQAQGIAQPGFAFGQAGQAPAAPPASPGGTASGGEISLEELMRQKEHLEDMIAELLAKQESESG